MIDIIDYPKYAWKHPFMEDTKMNICKRCDYRWISKVALPKQCPACKSYRWNTEQTYTLHKNLPTTTPILGKKGKERLGKEKKIK